MSSLPLQLKKGLILEFSVKNLSKILGIQISLRGVRLIFGIVQYNPYNKDKKVKNFLPNVSGYKNIKETFFYIQ